MGRLLQSSANFELLFQRPDGTFIRPYIQDNADGTFNVIYTPEDLGVYDVIVKYAGKNVPGAPFPVKATPTGDANKCRITGASYNADLGKLLLRVCLQVFVNKLNSHSFQK